MVTPAASAAVPPPPSPFEPLTVTLTAGTLIHRVHSGYPAESFNPNTTTPPGACRFSPFVSQSDPLLSPVPTLYAAGTREAAVCESILHDVPLSGGLLPARKYRSSEGSVLRLRRDLKLCSLLGDGLTRLNVRSHNLTATDGDVYEHTVRWAAAAHQHSARFDGIAWMSGRRNTDPAYMFFGDRFAPSDLEATGDGIGSFALGTRGFDWLSAYCSRLQIELLLA